MTEPPTTPFVFAVCQVGAEGALKQELAREHPELRFAYSRPGFVTWKSTAGPVGPDVRLRSVFARAYGASVGPAADAEAACATARRFLPAGAAGARLHVFARDVARPDEEAPEASEAARAAVAAALADLRAAGGALFLAGDVARRGELVLDVIVAAGEPWWVGCHVHGEGHAAWPGGAPPVEVPAEAPSRAYRKLEEALAWSGAPVRAGEVALEIGSAPGGATFALLRRGVNVVGVDPGAMDPAVLAFEGPGGARATHLQVAVGGLRREQLPERVDWLLLDVNLAPQVALHAVRRLVPPLRRTLRGVLFTLKLNDWRMAAEVPALVERVRALGMAEVRATQLPANRQEIFVYGRTPLGVATRRRPGSIR